MSVDNKIVGEEDSVGSWIDVHTHLNILAVNPEEALARGRSAGVERFITIGTTPEDHQEVLNLAQTLGSQVYCTLGVHPHEAHLYSAEVEKNIRQNVNHEKVLAIGEIGLDYYYDNAPRETQKEVFRSQLQMALEANLPVEIHTREAEDDTLEILREFSGKVRGLIHCFTGTMGLAEEALKLGLDISISGVVTFKNADSLREICREIPLDRLHLETDSPFLAPVPERGKKNEPAFIAHTARSVANLKSVSINELSAQMRKNALRLFPKLKWPVEVEIK